MGIETAIIGAVGTMGAAAISKPKGIQAPAQRSYLGEMQDALRSQGKIQGSLLDLERQYTPQWQQLQQETLSGQMGTLNALYGQAGQYSQGLQSAYLGMQAPLYGQVGEASRKAYQQTLDPTAAGLYNTMASQAASGLADGRNLSEQEMRMSQGNARAAMAARGMQFGNQAIAAEVLNSYNLSNAREDRARQFATNMYGIGQQNATQAMQMYGQPLMNQMNTVSPTALLGTAGQMSAGLGAKLFQPESQYNAGVYGANQSNETQTRLANAQAQQGWASGLTSMVGNMAGAYLSNPNAIGINNQQTGSGGLTAVKNQTAQYGGLGQYGQSPYRG
jgi:hypothetical protein